MLTNIIAIMRIVFVHLSRFTNRMEFHWKRINTYTQLITQIDVDSQSII